MHRVRAFRGVAILAAIVSAATAAAVQWNDRYGQPFRLEASQQTGTVDSKPQPLRLPVGEPSALKPAASPQTAVAIPDSALRTAIARRLGKSADDTITQADLARLQRLGCWSCGIADLTGLEYAINLVWLDLPDNPVQDASPLSNLRRLIALRLQDNQVTDLSPLAGNVALQTLHIGAEGLSDISPLANLQALTELWIQSSPVSNITVLSGLTALQTLYMPHNEVSDISPLAGLASLQVLHLPANPIADISPLAELTALTSLSLGEASITDISALAGLTALKNLKLYRNSISRVDALESLTALEELNLYQNSISDISALAAMTSMQNLSIGSNSIADISSLRNMTELERLSAYSNAITDVSPLAGLTALKTLWIGHNDISDISAFTALTAMETLHISDAAIVDVSPLSGMTNLEVLHGSYNAISDITSLASLTSLRRLYLGRNRITDLSPLTGLTALEHLFLTENAVTTITSLANLSALTWLWVGGNDIVDVSDVAGLENLQDLSLGGNAVCDISALAGLSSLTYVRLSYNAIQDIGPLVANTALDDGDRVILTGNPLDPEAVTVHIPALQARGVAVTFVHHSSTTCGDDGGDGEGGVGDQRLDTTTFAPEFYLDEELVYVNSVAFGADRFFALDAGRTTFPGWPCDEECLALSRPRRTPSVSAYTTAGQRDPNLGFEPFHYDGADHVEAITYADGKLYVLNNNPPKVHVYTIDGQRVEDEDFYLWGGERYRGLSWRGRINSSARDFVYAAGRFYVLDGGSNRDAPKVFVYDIAGKRIPEAEFRIDGLRPCGPADRSCEFVQHIAHADGILYVKVWLFLPGWPPVEEPSWLYTLDGIRTGTFRFDDSAGFTKGMTPANGWFYLLSHFSVNGSQRICAYTLQGQRVESNAVGGRYC